MLTFGLRTDRSSSRYMLLLPDSIRPARLRLPQAPSTFRQRPPDNVWNGQAGALKGARGRTDACGMDKRQPVLALGEIEICVDEIEMLNLSCAGEVLSM